MKLVSRVQDGKLLVCRSSDPKPLVELSIVQATQEHRSFIISTWVRSYQAEARKWMPRDMYNAEDAAVAERMWDKCHVVTSDGYTIVAWVCAHNGVLHHCYVIPDMRRKGVCRALTDHLLGTTVTIARPWPFPKPAGWRYNPFKIAGEP